MSGLLPEWQGMPELLPDGHINQRKRSAERRWREQEDARLMIADKVGRVAATRDQEKEDAMRVAKQVARECRDRVAEQRGQQ